MTRKIISLCQEKYDKNDWITSKLRVDNSINNMCSILSKESYIYVFTYVCAIGDLYMICLFAFVIKDINKSVERKGERKEKTYL